MHRYIDELRLLQAIRLAVIMRIFILAAQLPRFTPTNEVSHDEIFRSALALEIQGHTDNVGGAADDDVPFDLLDDLAAEADPRVERLLHLVRERGWDGLARLLGGQGG